MQVIPDQRNSKTTAIMLLLIALLLVYLLVFHWFILRHGEYAEEIGDLPDTCTTCKVYDVLAKFAAKLRKAKLHEEAEIVRKVRDKYNI